MRLLSFIFAAAFFLHFLINAPDLRTSEAVPLRGDMPEVVVPKEPLPDIVRRVSKDFGIPYAFTDALIQVESGWNPEAINFNYGGKDIRKADHGLMQVNFRTASRLGVSDWKELYTDPEKNVILGHRVISECYNLANRNKIQSQKEKWRYTAACYNAGPGNWRAGLPHAEKVLRVMEQKLFEELA